MKQGSPGTISGIVARAAIARAEFASWGQQRIDDLVACAAWQLFRPEVAGRLTELAIRETGIGNETDSRVRLEKRILGTLNDLHGAKTVGEVEVDEARGIRRYAKPVGTVAALIPATSPVSCLAVHALSLLKTRNAAVFCPNPRAKGTVAEATRVLRQGLLEAGAPIDLLQCIEAPSRELAVELMESADLVVATGGSGTVERARRTGTPAYTGGTGNSVVIVDDTADVAKAAALIADGKAFDHGTSCSSESSIVVCRALWEVLLTELESRGAHLCSAAEADRLRGSIWPAGRGPVSAAVGKSVGEISELAGLSVPRSARMLLVMGNRSPEAEVLAGEKLSPVLSVWLYDDFDEALDLLERLLRIDGPGHSCGIHSASQSHIDAVAARANVSRIMVNQSTCFGNSGDSGNGMPFTVTLSCGTWGGSASTENINYRHLLNYVHLSVPLQREVLTADQLFSRHWERYGR